MKKLLIVGMVCLMFFAAGSADANFTIVFDPSQTFNTSVGGAPPSGSITAEFIDVSAGVVNLVINNNLVADEKVGALYFNFMNTISAANNLLFSLTAFGATGNSTPATISVGNEGFKADGDGNYDILLGFSTANNVAFQGGQSQTYQITGTGTFASSGSTPLLASYFNALSSGSNGAYLGAVHVQGIGTASTSAFVAGAPVPVPAAVWLLGSGLLGLIGIGRRMKLG